MDIPGKTKKGTNWAKNYSIKQSRTPNPNFMANMTAEPKAGVAMEDIPF